LNQRPLGYEPNELPDCSTPQAEYTRAARGVSRLFSGRSEPPRRHGRQSFDTEDLTDVGMYPGERRHRRIDRWSREPPGRHERQLSEMEDRVNRRINSGGRRHRGMARGSNKPPIRHGGESSEVASWRFTSSFVCRPVARSLNGAPVASWRFISFPALPAACRTPPRCPSPGSLGSWRSGRRREGPFGRPPPAGGARGGRGDPAWR
jgi:hypothetical protein